MNAVAAGAIDVPGGMIWQWISETGTRPEQIIAALPVGRMGKPEELVAAACSSARVSLASSPNECH